MPEISIIVPVYNVEKYLRRCLDSILAQTFKDFELILVDDGATDKSGEICDEYAKSDSRIRVIHKENGGLSDARNTGIEAAAGKYLGFVDSDDYIAEDMYELLYNNLIEKNADVSVCRVMDCYENHIETRDMKRDVFVLNSKQAIKMVMEAEVVSVHAVAKLYKKYIFDDIRFPLGKQSEDAFVALDVLKKANTIVVTTEAKYYYIHRCGSITSTEFGEKDLAVIEAYEKNLSLIKEYYPDLESIGEMRCIWARFYVLDKILLSKNFHDKNLKKKIVKELRASFIDVLNSPYFTNERKICMISLMFSVSLYKALLTLKKKKDRRLHD